MLSKPAMMNHQKALYIFFGQSLVRVTFLEHGGRAHSDGSSGLGWSGKYGKYEG